MDTQTEKEKERLRIFAIFVLFTAWATGRQRKAGKDRLKTKIKEIQGTNKNKNQQTLDI